MDPKKQRQDVRVRDYVRLRVIPIEENARQPVLDQIAIERLESGGEESLYYSERMARDMREHVELPNTQLMNMLQMLNSKIDAILMHLLERNVEEKWGPSVPVDISASGIRFASGEKYEIKQLLRLEIMMHTMPPRPIITLAEVMRVDDQDPEWGTDKPLRVAARFLDLDTIDRDRIVKRIFDIQRMILRRSRNAKAEQTG